MICPSSDDEFIIIEGKPVLVLHTKSTWVEDIKMGTCTLLLFILKIPVNLKNKQVMLKSRDK